MENEYDIIEGMINLIWEGINTGFYNEAEIKTALHLIGMWNIYYKPNYERVREEK